MNNHVQNIHPVQNKHLCAKYTPLCKIYTPVMFNVVQWLMESGDGVLIATDRCTHGGHHSTYLPDDDDDPMLRGNRSMYRS